MSYQDKMGDLASLDEAGLKALEQEILDAFEAADQADDVDAMAAAADALDQVREALNSQPDESGEQVSESETTEESEEIAVAASAAENQTSETQEESGKDKNEEAVVASATDQEADVDIPEDRKPVANTSPVAITAGADIPGKSAGSEFRSIDEVSRSMVHRIQSISRASGGDGEQHIVATITASAQPERVLMGNDVEGNLTKIREATSLSAITAAGWCAPLDTRYDLFGIGVGDRPVRDALVGFQASRGGIRFQEPPVLGDLSGAVSVWDGVSAKPSLTVTCGNEVTAEAEAVTLQLEFGNMMSRAYPELVTRNNELALIEHSRLAENNLLALIKQQSIAVTASKKWGATRDILLALGKAAAAYRYKHRLPRSFPLRGVAPQYLLDIMREDLSVGLPGDNLTAADSAIENYLSSRGVSISWHLDGHHGARATDGGAVGALTDRPAYDFTTAGWDAFPTTAEVGLWAEGSFLFLDGGTLDLGVVRDSALVGSNSYKTFVETFEGVAKVGVDALWITATVDVAGAVTGTLDPAA